MPKILIVEDNEASREILERRLARAGCEVLALAGGKEVLSTILREQPALVILDIQLPDANGLELTRQIKGDARTSSTPVAILTASAREEDAQLALQAGCDAFLTKPFEWAPLWERLQALLNQPR